MSGEQDPRGPHGASGGAGRESQSEAQALRSFEHGSSGATADRAVNGRRHPEDAGVDSPYARPAVPLADGEKPDQLAEKKAAVGDDFEAGLDEAMEESFPASDPPSYSPRRG